MKLDRYLLIQEPTKTQGTSLGAKRTWSNVGTVMAERMSASGQEAEKAGAVRAEATEVFRVRFLTWITTQHRLVFEGRTFDILDVLEDTRERRTWTLLPARYTEGRPT